MQTTSENYLEEQFDNRYSIVSVLGEGGMGVVYLAIDTKLGNQVALKALRSELVLSESLMASLSKEVALSQELNHPNLLQVRHLETRSDAPYVIMELMDGGDVEEVLAKHGGKLSLMDAISYTKQCLKGLAALHQQSILHLDIKPANLLLNKMVP